MRTTSYLPLAGLLLASLVVLGPASGSSTVGPAASPPPPIQAGWESAGSASAALGVNYTVTFHAVGLPTPTYWAVSFAGQFRSTTSVVIQFLVPNGTYGFSVSGGGTSYTPQPSSGSLSVNGSDVDFNVTFLLLYNLLFVQTGLPNNSPWFVFLQLLNKNAYTPATITYRVPNGTYNFTAGSSLPYNVYPKTGVLVVKGASLQTNITFVPVPRYPVKFPVTGLPSGLSYWVSLGGGNNRTGTAGNALILNWTLSNGSYPWTAGTPSPYLVRPSSGTVVVNGTGVTTTLTFVLPTTYPLVFVQHGLPTGTAWSVVLDGTNTGQGPSGANIVFNVANGSHSYVINTNSGLAPFPSTGFEGIAGKGATVWINFSTASPGGFSVVFTEQGLPNGTWSVSLAGAAQTGPVGVGLTFANISNGNYAFTVAGVPGYTPAPATGAANVNGKDLVVAIQFTANGSAPVNRGNATLASSLSGYEPAIVITGLLIVGLIVWMLARRGRAASGERSDFPGRGEAPEPDRSERPPVSPE